MDNIRELFFKMVNESQDEIENFNDFAKDRAIVWAGNKIKEYEEEIKNLTEGYGLLLKEHHNLKDALSKQLRELCFTGETAPEAFIQQELEKLADPLA